MKFENMSLKERREYFKQRIRGGENSAINKQRKEEAKKFQDEFYKKMKNERIEENIGKEPGE